MWIIVEYQNFLLLQYMYGLYDELILVQLGFSLDRVTTDKNSSSILIYTNKDTEIYTENNGVNLIYKAQNIYI